MLFQKSVIKQYLKNLDKTKVSESYEIFQNNFSPTKIEKIKNMKEEEYQDGFLRDLFVDVLGYTLKPEDDFNLVRERKNETDSKKADGAIIKDDKVIAVIELKSTATKDLKAVTDQAFGYKNNQSGCKYVITSNFQKLRFYIDYTIEFEEFDLFSLSREDFEKLYLILSRESIFSDLPSKLKKETKLQDEIITNKLYRDYSVFKDRLYQNLIKNNPQYDKLTLFQKSQKLLDRFLFILFAEDSGLLPPNSISRIIQRFDVLTDEDAYKPLYEIYKQYFGYMNTGREGKTRDDHIPAYNGGLFYPDQTLDSLIIDDDVLKDDLIRLSAYDFNTEVDVNILGHIFEHSLSEIEEITAEIEGVKADKTKSRRKKDGVFYTPKYITQYIVENTIGTLCREKRQELEIVEIEFDGTYRKTDGTLSVKGKTLFDKLESYQKWLLTLKIVDPACGSGAFLNQALNFLIQEHKTIDDIIAELTNSPLRLFDTDKAILENNLYGVDINEESVEIAKLSLWLRTAHKDRKLSNLNNNIKCGNSLIDDPQVAGDKAFDWAKEFPDIMKNGGFDVVIGNPPYGAKLTDEEKKYLNIKYIKGGGETAISFMKLSYDLLSRHGNFGFIVPKSSSFASNYNAVRDFLFDYITENVDCGKVWKEVKL
ncbi:MAG: N-6 DNA methylase, partial [Candidatus Delongbacteria bacterium]|nr:N-6 DNA methylase [Candidatus Delongbacteria bacterium]